MNGIRHEGGLRVRIPARVIAARRRLPLAALVSILLLALGSSLFTPPTQATARATSPASVSKTTHSTPAGGKPAASGKKSVPAKPAAKRKPPAPKPIPPASLKEDLSASLAASPLRGASVGALVLSASDGKVVFERNALLPLAPASTMKALTTAAILDRLGPDYRYETRFLTDGSLENGIVSGNLFIRGSGDPSLVIERWWDMAEELKAAGIVSIKGNIIGDDAFFDGERRAPGWPSASNSSPYNPTISALSANFNTVRVSVIPGTPGKQPIIHADPPSDLVRVNNRARTGKGNSLWISRSYNGDVNTINVSGTISTRSGGASEWLTVEEPSRVAAAVLLRTLREAGLTVPGSSFVGTVPPNATLLASFRSKPLSEIIADTNKNSNNFMAECLQRTLGAVASGIPGTRDKGAGAVSEFLTRIGTPMTGIDLIDGSGLAAANRVTTKALVTALNTMIHKPETAAAFFNSLPICGIDGTLERRMPDVRGRVVAKTGTISRVRALAGYVLDDDDRPAYIFAILLNDYRCSDAGAVLAIDEFARRIAHWASPSYTLRASRSHAPEPQISMQ